MYNDLVATVVAWYWKESKISKMVPEAVLDDCKEGTLKNLDTWTIISLKV